MPPRSFWKGYLKLSLVTCPVAMMPATSDADRVRFHTLNRATGNRVQSQYLDAETDKPVAAEAMAKGYQNGADQYVMLEDDELESVALESTRTIDIETFVAHQDIQWIWYDTPHYLVPNDKVGEEAFSVIREAMRATGTVGIARLVMGRRERAVMLEPRARGIVLWTLRYGDEVRDEAPYFAGVHKETLEPKLVEMLAKVIEARTVAWKPALVRDPVQEKLREIIAAKRKGRKAPVKKAAEGPKSNVVNIMDALRKSLEK